MTECKHERVATYSSHQYASDSSPDGYCAECGLQYRDGAGGREFEPVPPPTDTEKLAARTGNEIVDGIYELFDELALHGRFEFADWLIIGLRFGVMTRDEILAVLTVTLPFKSKVSSRTTFVDTHRYRLTADEVRGLE